MGKERGIIPYFEIITNQGRAKEFEDLAVSNEQLREAFDSCRRLTKNGSLISGLPAPPSPHSPASVIYTRAL